MNICVDERFMCCAVGLADELEREIAVPANMTTGLEQDAGYDQVERHENEVGRG